MAIQVQKSWSRTQPSSIGIEVTAETDLFAALLTVSQGIKGQRRVPSDSDGVVGLHKGQSWTPSQSPWSVGNLERCELLLGLLNKGDKVAITVTIGERAFGPYKCTVGDEFISARFKLFVG